MSFCGNTLCVVHGNILLYTPHDGLLSIYSADETLVRPLDCHVLHDVPPVPTLPSSSLVSTHPLTKQKEPQKANKLRRKFPFHIDFLEPNGSTLEACLLAWSEVNAAVVHLAGVTEGYYYSVTSLLTKLIGTEDFGKLVCCRWLSKTSTSTVVLLSSQNELYLVSVREPEKVIQQCSLRLPLATTGIPSTMSTKGPPVPSEGLIGFQQFVCERTEHHCVFSSFDSCEFVDDFPSQVHIFLTTKSGEVYWLVPSSKSTVLPQGNLSAEVRSLEEQFHSVMHEIGAVTVPEYTRLVGPIRTSKGLSHPSPTFSDLRVILTEPPTLLLANSNAEVEMSFLSGGWFQGNTSQADWTILPTAVLPFCVVKLQPPMNDWRKSALQADLIPQSQVRVYQSPGATGDPYEVLAMTSDGSVFSITLPDMRRSVRSGGLKYPTVVCWVNILADLSQCPVVVATLGATLFQEKNSRTQLLTLHPPLPSNLPLALAAAATSTSASISSESGPKKPRIIHHGVIAWPPSFSFSLPSEDASKEAASLSTSRSFTEPIRAPLYLFDDSGSSGGNSPLLLQSYLRAIMACHARYLNHLQSLSEAVADALTHSSTIKDGKLSEQVVVAMVTSSKAEATEWQEVKHRLSVLQVAQEPLKATYFSQTNALQDFLLQQAGFEQQRFLPSSEQELMLQLRKIQQTCVPYLQLLIRSVKDSITTAHASGSSSSSNS